jgi:hypothetical protein
VTFGPWSLGIDSAERLARFRVLAALAAVFCRCNHPLVDELRQVERDGEAAARAFTMLERLPALTRRRLLSTYSAVHSPRRPR